MRLPDYHWRVVRGLPSALVALFKRALRLHGQRRWSDGYARRAAMALDTFATALEDHAARQAVNNRSLEAALEVQGQTGAHPGPEGQWDAMGKGARAVLVRAMNSRDASDHAIDLSRRIIKAMQEGRDDSCGV